jgi:uridine phosphorylase
MELVVDANQQRKEMLQSELVLRSDGKVYHLKLSPGDVAETVLLVGDPKRVAMISNYFDSVELKVVEREFVTHTGMYQGKRLTVLGTGIGIGNLDIVVNELDAIANIDFATREIKPHLTSYNLIRLGTCGCVHPEVSVESLIASKYTIGLDNLLFYYDVKLSSEEAALEQALTDYLQDSVVPAKPYVVACNNDLFNSLGSDLAQGITITAPGFYGPQNRWLRAKPRTLAMMEKLEKFEFNNYPVMNFEMEASALYGLGGILGHRCLTVCTVVANRLRGEFVTDHHAATRHMIETMLQRIVAVI